MKHALLLLLATCLAIFLSAQPSKQWDARYGGWLLETFTSIQVTQDGGYILGGTSRSGETGDKTQPSQGDYDYWMVKLDSTGQKLWDVRFGGTETDVLYGLVQTPDGGYLLAGTTLSPLSGDVSEDSKGGNDYWIVKTDSNGVKQWDKRFGGSNTDFLHAIVQTGDNGFLLAGHSASGISGDKSEASKGSTDYWIIRTDETGNKLWDKTIGGLKDENLFAAEQTSDGGFVIGGWSNSGIGADKSEANKGGGVSTDFWVVKTDANGNKEWDKTFGGNNTENLFAIHQTPDSGYLFGGWTDSPISDDVTQASDGKIDYWIVKTDADGTKLWDSRFGGTNDDELYSILENSDGTYLFGGRSLSDSSGDKTENNDGSVNTFDYWIVKCDGNGVKLWDKSFGGSEDDDLTSMDKSPDGGYILGGDSGSPISGDKSQNVQGPFGQSDYWILKTEPDLLLSCYIPAGEFADEVTNNSAKVHWDAVAAANKYKVQYRINGTTTWSKASTANTYKKLKELQPNTEYDWKVKSVCTDLDLGKSAWSAIQNFKTLPARLSNDLTIDDRLIYPNPFSSSATIEFNLSQSSPVSIKLFSVDGKKVMTIAEGNFSEEKHLIQFNRENLAAGIYFLQVKTSSENFTEKIVIE